MLIRVTELEGGGCKVALVTAEGERDHRVVSSIAEAFALQGRAELLGGFPPEPQPEPEVSEAKAKKGKSK